MGLSPGLGGQVQHGAGQRRETGRAGFLPQLPPSSEWDKLGVGLGVWCVYIVEKVVPRDRQRERVGLPEGEERV
ncbi:hypothetical protein CLAIMM_02857 [Cladophialophora immunda]|nr:hypothetical protein CLAIMM_02857 [Cladophialophora immunda]